MAGGQRGFGRGLNLLVPLLLVRVGAWDRPLHPAQGWKPNTFGFLHYRQ